MVERLDHDVPRHLEPAAQIIPERDAKLVAGLGQSQKRIAAELPGASASINWRSSSESWKACRSAA
jgi:hypothetical protein